MRRLLGVLIGVALGSAMVAVPASDATPRAAAQAGGPTITVTPADGLVTGQAVDVEVTGMSGDVVVSQCAPENVQTVDGALRAYLAHCRNTSVPGVSGSVVVPLTLEEQYVTNFRGEIVETRCGGAGPDCFVTAVQTSDYSAVATPIHFGPPRPEPAVTVTPASGLRDGDVVEVQVTGFGAESQFRVGQCIGEVATAPDPGSVIDRWGACVSFTGGGGWDDPWTGSITIVEAWTWGEPDDVQGNRCRDAPGSCVIAAYAPESGTLVTAPLDVDPSPLVVVPADQEAGFPVQVFASGRPGATVTVAQCAEPVRRKLAGSRCSGASTITLDGRGEAMVPFELREVVGRWPRQVRCPDAGCAIALFDRRGRTIATSPVVVYPADGPPVLSVEPDVGLVDGQEIEVTISEARNDGLWVALCDRSVVTTGDVDTGPCNQPQLITVGRDSASVLSYFSAAVSFTGADGSTVRCGHEPGDCVIAGESLAGESVAAVPLSFAAVPSP